MRRIVPILILFGLLIPGVLVANEPASTNLSPFGSNLVFSRGGMSGQYLYFVDWSSTYNYQIDTILEHDGELWWAETDPAVGDEPGTATAWTKITGTGGGGATITSGTGDPTGGSAGDFYVEVDGSSVVQSLWRNVSGTWTEYTIPSGGTLADGSVTLQKLADAVVNGLTLFPDSNGELPDASLAANQGRIAVSGNHLLQSTDHGAVDRDVTFKRYGPDRVVLTGEPARTSQENNYQGAFNVPPDISAYDASDFLWDRGSQIWLFKQNQNDVTWRGFGGPAGFAHGSLYATEALAEPHVSETGKVYVIGQGSGQHVFIVTSYTAATDENWLWDPLGVTLGDIQSAIEAHDTSATAHNDIRSDVSDVEDRLDALDGVEIEAYSSTATYSRGSANSIVTHTDGLFIYISSTERSSGHDPDTQPGYWLRLSEGVAYEVITSGSHRIAARTIVVNGDNDNVYLCTTTQTTPRDLDYIHAQSETTGGSFILLNGGGTGGGFTLRSGSTAPGSTLGDDGDWYLRTSNGQWYEKASGAWVSRYTDQLGMAGGGLTAVSTSTALTGDGTSSDPLDIADGGVDTTELADDAVTGDKIADNTIHGGALIDGTIATGKIGDDQVTGAKLSGNAVSTGKVADDAITQAKIADDAVTTAKIADLAVTSAKLAANAAGEGKVPIDDTMQFDGSGDLGVNTQRVIQVVSEWVQHFASGSAHDTSGHSGKYQEYRSSNTVRRIGSVQYDFTPGNSGGTRTYQVFIVELTGRNIDAILGSSEVYSGNNLQHRFHFTDGVTINPNVRIGIGLHRTDGGNNEALSVRFGTESQDSPRESYDDASEDFNFLGRFNHDRPTPSVNDSVGGTTAGEIYGNPEIFYQIIHTHESLVGDGTVSSDHISSGSAADGEVLTADGSSGSAWEAVPDSGLSESEVDARVTAGVLDFAETGNTDKISAGKIPGSLTHRQAAAVTVSGSTLTIPTEDSVQAGDTVLFVIPTPWSVTGNLTVRVSQGGNIQASTTLALNDRVGTRLTGGDVVAEEEMEIILATDWRSLVHPVGTGSGASLSDATPDSLQPDQTGSAGTGTTASRHDHSHAISSSTPVGLGTSNQEGNFTSFARTNHVHRAFDTVLPSSHGIGQSGSPGTATTAARRDHVHAIPVGVPVTVGTANAEGTATTAARSDHVHAGGPIAEHDSTLAYSKGAQAWTGTGAAFTVWTANQDISANSTTPTRTSPQNWIVESGPGSIRGLLSPINVNVLRVGDIFWHEEISDAPKVYFTRTAGSYSNTLGDDPDDFIELTAPASRLIPSGGTDGQVLTKASGTDYDTAWEDAASGGAITGFTELRAPATLDVAQTWTATGATIPAADGDEWVRMNGNFDGEVPENFEFLSSRLRSLAEHLVGGSTSTGDVERLQFHDGSVFQRVLMARTADNELILRHEASTQSLGNLSVYSYSSIAGDGVLTEDPLTGTDKNFDFTSAAATGQNRELFDSDVTLPTDIGDHEVFILRVVGDSGENNILLTKVQLDALTAVTPVTWASQTTNGVTADQTGDDRNALLFPLGQNRGFFLGISNETPYRLQWGASAPYTFSIQIIRVTSAGGSGGQDSPGGEESDNSISGAANTFDETTIDEPSGTWGFVNFGDIGEHFSGEWHRFLVADLTGQTESTDGATINDSNSLMFVANEEHYFFLGHNSGGKVLVGTSDAATTPGNVRIRSN